MQTRNDVTRAILELTAGDRRAADRLYPLVYDELRQIAHRCFAGEGEGHTLQPTALVHEAYVRLVDQTQIPTENRAQFFAIAARAMRRILVDHARGRRAAKRGGAIVNLTLNDALVTAEEKDVYLIALNGALDELGAFDPQLAKVVELRFFGGLTIEETADALDLSPKTVNRQWALARAWLHHRVVQDG